MLHKNKPRDYRSSPGAILSDYQPLVLNGKTIQQLSEFKKYAEWHVIPAMFKKIKFRDEFAASINVSEDILRCWSACPLFQTVALRAFGKWKKESGYSEMTERCLKTYSSNINY